MNDSMKKLQREYPALVSISQMLEKQSKEKRMRET